MLARAPNTASMRRKPVIPRIEEAAGISPLTTVPAGATIRKGRKSPAVLGISSCITDLMHRATTEAVNESVQLIAPLTCFSEPVKSAVRESPFMVIFT